MLADAPPLAWERPPRTNSLTGGHRGSGWRRWTS